MLRCRGAFLVFLVFCLLASCCLATVRGAPASRSPAAWMPVDVMIAPSEDHFWTDMREGQMKLKIRVRRMKESRDKRGLSAGPAPFLPMGTEREEGAAPPEPCFARGPEIAFAERPAGSGARCWPYKERRQLASGEMEASGERAEGSGAERWPVPS